VPDSGPKTGAVFRPLMVILTERGIAVQVLGPESGTENGSAFRPQRHQKKTPLASKNRPPWLTKIGHCHAMVRLDIPPHVPKVSKYQKRPQSRLSLATPTLHKMSTAEPYLNCKRRLQAAHAFRRGRHMQGSSTVIFLFTTPKQRSNGTCAAKTGVI
jgi:hypothetical protein